MFSKVPLQDATVVEERDLVMGLKLLDLALNYLKLNIYLFCLFAVLPNVAILLRVKNSYFLFYFFLLSFLNFLNSTFFNILNKFFSLSLLLGGILLFKLLIFKDIFPTVGKNNRISLLVLINVNLTILFILLN